MQPAIPPPPQVVYADITQPKTLSPSFLSGVKAVVCATAVRVQPKEGDTPDRKKYMQGVKFYDPGARAMMAMLSCVITSSLPRAQRRVLPARLP